MKKYLESIQRDTGLSINSSSFLTSGADSVVIEVNNEWIFRFPKTRSSIEKMKVRVDFLRSFSRHSPLLVPYPEYVSDDFIGYKKIEGTPMLQEEISSLSDEKRKSVAHQLGDFLSALHSFKNHTVDFDPGYHMIRPNDYLVPEPIFKSLLTSSEFVELERRYRSISENPDNFVAPTSVIHGDFHFNNILWDKKACRTTGIIDWAECGLGIPALDFIGIANFNDPANDSYLKEILSSYSDDSVLLFSQIKELAIIDTLNWLWWYAKKNQIGRQRHWAGQLKKVLNNDF